MGEDRARPLGRAAHVLVRLAQEAHVDFVEDEMRVGEHDLVGAGHVDAERRADVAQRRPQRRVWDRLGLDRRAMHLRRGEHGHAPAFGERLGDRDERVQITQRAERRQQDLS